MSQKEQEGQTLGKPSESAACGCLEMEINQKIDDLGTKFLVLRFNL